ncbi:AmmeMemoRadiSam system protein B [Thermoproteota archaeon]
MALRRPAVAGAFYAASPEKLRKQIIDCFKHPLGPGRLPNSKHESNIVSVVCPHAGYAYSGPAASHSFLALGEQSTPESVVIIGPNHTGWGTPVSLMSEGSWQTPLGNVSIDTELSNLILKKSCTTRRDESAFIREHSLEVQLPFLQFIYPEFKFVPICMRYQDLETSIELGQAIFEASMEKEVLVIASSDLTHQESKESANKKDKYVLEAIRNLDEVQLQESVKRERITTCGYGSISVALVFSKLRKATNAEVLSYYTSGDIIGDSRKVVGYAAAKITRNR